MKREHFDYDAFSVGDVYTRDEVASLGRVEGRQPWDWGGITQFKNCWLLWLTLDKRDKQPNHRYNDCFEDQGKTLLWESQNQHTLQRSEIKHILAGEPVVVLARISSNVKGVTQPFCYCGQITNSVAGREENPVRLRSQVAQFSTQPTEALRDLYNWKPNGPRLVTDAEVLEEALPLSQTSTRRKSNGQGRSTDPERNKATERRAIIVAMEHYANLGWAVEDVGVPGMPFDLLCTKEGSTLHVEVKGTRGDASSVNVTHGEVISARDVDVPTHLFIVHGITVVTDGDTVIGEGGEMKCLEPWLPTDSDLQPTMYRYEVPQT
ncbi:DUF3427 domain-containing protein [Luminiphilus sp.]|nr:DUF3427 domain-containing protein [Luminiphilus sp.]